MQIFKKIFNLSSLGFFYIGKNVLSHATLNAGVERTLLQDVYRALLSQAGEASCRPDCSSLVIGMKTEVDVFGMGMDKLQSVRRHGGTLPEPLPPISLEVKLSLPDLYKSNEVRY